MTEELDRSIAAGSVNADLCTERRGPLQFLGTWVQHAFGGVVA